MAACTSPALIVGVLSIAWTTATSAAAGSSVSSSSKLKALTNSINHGKHLTYEAVYKSVSPGGQTQTVTIAQSPPKTIFSASGGSVIDTGKTTYYCSDSNGSTTWPPAPKAVVGNSVRRLWKTFLSPDRWR